MPRSLGDTRRSLCDRRAASPPWESTTCGSIYHMYMTGELPLPRGRVQHAARHHQRAAPRPRRDAPGAPSPHRLVWGEDRLASPRLASPHRHYLHCRRARVSSRARPSPLAEARSGAGPAPRTCPPRAAIGHPAVIEAGVCLGGRDAKPGITVYRFANRTPPPARRGLLRTAAPHTLWRGQASPSSSRAAVTSPPSSARSGSRGQTTRSDTRRTPTADRGG